MKKSFGKAILVVNYGNKWERSKEDLLRLRELRTFNFCEAFGFSLVHHREHGVHRVKKRCLLICDYQRDLRENRGKVNFNGKRKLPYPWFTTENRECTE